MINAVYFDLDETLAHTSWSEPAQKHIHFTLQDYGPHWTIIRPDAQRVIDYARELVGEDKVFILTAAIKEYACEIDRLAGWGFGRKRIFARENLQSHRAPTAYGGSTTIAHSQANLNNVLIDNLFPRSNESKIGFLGIWPTYETNYLKVHDYFGLDFAGDPFYNNVTQFLRERHEADSFNPVPVANDA